MDKEIGNIAIIGGGPAGLTAGIYAARAFAKPVIFMGPEPGGQLTKTTIIENYPGFPNGIQAPVLMEDFKKQAENFGASIRNETIISVDFSSWPFLIKSDTGKEEYYYSIIIATGASPKYLGLPEEEKFKGRGLSTCAICDGFFYKGKKVAVIGGGDSACEEALYLSNLTNEVYMILRRNVFRASPIMQKRVLSKNNIKIIYENIVEKILGDELVEKIILKNTQNGSRSELKIDGVFLAIGHKPNSEIFKKWIKTDQEGYILIQNGSTKTNVEGIFACGDVVDKKYRQAITAAGLGCMASIDAIRFLQQKGIL